MKKFLALFVLIFLFFTAQSNAQSSTKDTAYIYGRMIGDDTLVGYFYFSDTIKITETGVQFAYRKNLGKGFSKMLNSSNYKRFESESVYMENFLIFEFEEYHLYTLIPLIVNGSIQLFHLKINKRELFAFKKDGYKSEFTKKSFKKQIAYLLDDDADLLGRVKRGEFGYKDIKQIILLYNESHPMQPVEE